MSEKLNLHPEQSAETAPLVEHHKPKAEQAERNIHKAEKDPAQAIAEARKTIHETGKANQAEARQQLAAAEQVDQTPHHGHVNRELKQITLRRELQHIRRRLSAPDRLLSRVIHQPIVRVVSETASKTVSRPSGLLGGGLVALTGTTGYLYLARHLGFEYNYGVFLVLFVAGFGLGITLELLVHLATRSSRSDH